MISYPNCKINLGLQILGKRNDGFHNLETVFYPLPLFDALEIIRSPKEHNVSFTTSGIEIPGETEQNIVYKAWQLLKQDFPDLPPVTIHLHKAIPPGTGLGAGSADGSFALLSLNRLFNLSLTRDQLLTYASILGSDCPFFILNKPSLATGRGEHLQPLQLDLSSYKIIVVAPSIHINTAMAFSQLKSFSSSSSLVEVLQQPIETWKENLSNDFEKIVFNQHPELSQIKEQLYTSGALYASLSGSGSSLYGIYPGQFTPSLSFPESYFVKLLP